MDLRCFYHVKTGPVKSQDNLKKYLLKIQEGNKPNIIY